MKRHPTFLSAFAFLTVSLVSLPSLKGGTPAPTTDGETEAFLDWLYGLPVLIDNPEARFIQNLALTGRYQGQGYALSSDEGDTEDWDHRRVWIGGEMTFLRKFYVKTDVVLDANDWDPAYSSLFESYLAYNHDPALNLNFGRRRPVFSQEFITSKNILTFERSLLPDQLQPGNIAGGWVNGDFGKGWQYDVGFYSGTLDSEYGDFSAGWVYMASLGYDFAAGGGRAAEKSLVRLDYMANDGDPGNDQAPPYGHSFSLNYTGDYGKFGMITDLLYATGIEKQPDVWGLVLMPSYNLTEKLQFVFRYQWANANGDNGLTLQKRYEQQAPDLTGATGDAYHAFYSGFNYRIYGDKLKFMTGVEYSTMDDNANDGGALDAWTGLAGIRLYF